MVAMWLTKHVELTEVRNKPTLWLTCLWDASKMNAIQRKCVAGWEREKDTAVLLSSQFELPMFVTQAQRETSKHFIIQQWISHPHLTCVLDVEGLRQFHIDNQLYEIMDQPLWVFKVALATFDWTTRYTDMLTFSKAGYRLLKWGTNETP